MIPPWQRNADHIRLTVKLTPNGGRDRVDGVEMDADGNGVLKVRVSAVPENGKANRALIMLLAATLRVAKSSMTIVSGETARKKILRIDGDPEDVISRLEKAVAG